MVESKRRYKLLFTVGLLAVLFGLIGFSLAQFDLTDKLSKPPVSCTANTFLQSLTGNSTVCNNVPLATTQTFFFSNETSVNVPYPSKRMKPMEELNTTVTITYPSVVNNVTFQNWTTQQGVLNQTFIPQGTWLIHIHASTNKASFVMIFANITEVNNTGTIIQTIGTTEHAILDTAEEDYDLTFLDVNATFLQSNTSRIQVNFIAHVLTDTPDVTLYFDGPTSAGLTFPSAQSLNTNNFVPYTGAISDVNLGTHNITVNNITSPDITNLINNDSLKLNKTGDGWVNLNGLNLTSFSNGFLIEPLSPGANIFRISPNGTQSNTNRTSLQIISTDFKNDSNNFESFEWTFFNQSNEERLYMHSSGTGTGIARPVFIDVNNINSPGVYISTTNAVGIGTTTPKEKLDVNGNVTIKGSTTIVYRCSVAGNLRAGVLTTVSTDCGTAVDTGLRVN